MVEDNDWLPDYQCAVILVPGHLYQSMYAHRKGAIKRCVIEILDEQHVQVIWCKMKERCLYLYLDLSECKMVDVALIRYLKKESSERLRQLKSYKGYRFDGTSFWCWHDFVEDFFVDDLILERFSSRAIMADYEALHPEEPFIHEHLTIYEKRRAEFMKQMKRS